MDKKMEQLFYAVLGGALVVKDKIEASNEEQKACQGESEEIHLSRGSSNGRQPEEGISL